jgi:arsenite methyltransferase
MTEAKQDIWSQWLLQRRFGGDQAELQAALTNYLYPWRDNVLKHADLGPDETLLDVGCGDGLIGFGALKSVESSQVIFSDISQDLLDYAQSLAREIGLLPRCRFVLNSADDLALIETSSVDVVTTRSVLIYVSAKQRAFSEFYRVLKPQGRLSIFEPINRFAYPEPSHIFAGYDVAPVIDIAQRLKALYERIQPRESDPMINFDERDLVAFAENAGFKEIHVELQIEVRPMAEKITWERFLSIASNPKVPTIAEAMGQSLTPDEIDTLTAHLRPLVEQGQGSRKLALAYLWATK